MCDSSDPATEAGFDPYPPSPPQAPHNAPPHLLDKGEHVGHDAAKLRGVGAAGGLGHLADDVGQDVVDGVALLRQLKEEEAGQVGDALHGVLEAEGQLANLALDLDHVVEDEVRQHHDRVLPHRLFRITQPAWTPATRRCENG